jgi:hypothetical protein
VPGQQGGQRLRPLQRASRSCWFFENAQCSSMRVLRQFGFDNVIMNRRLLPSSTSARTRLILNLLAVIVLICGLGSATSIWLAQDRIDRQGSAGGTDVTGSLSPQDSRRYTHDVELYYGETGLLMDKWKRGWEEMTHGKPLATTIALASLVVAGGCFYLAANQSIPNGVSKPNIRTESP